MNAEHHIFQRFRKRIQIIQLDPEGIILDSCDTLFSLADSPNFNAFAQIPLLEGLKDFLLELPEGETFRLPGMNEDFSGEPAIYDMEFSRMPHGIQWMLMDLSREYEVKRELQQTRNEGSIHAENLVLRNEKIRLENSLLEQQKQEMERMREFRTEFFSSISHELRTPANGIIGLARLLEGEIQSDEAREYLAALESSGMHLVALVNDLMDIGKMEAGKLKFEAIPFSPTKIAQTVRQNLLYKATEKGIELEIRTIGEVPEMLVGDPMRLTQILFNLVGNALKFTPKGSITVEMSHNGVGEMTFRVIDTGIGIEPEKIETIFEHYQQATLETTRKYGGTGLGLSVVKKLVDLQGGRILVTSEPGKGSAFEVQIPYENASVATKSTISLQGFRVLLAEDNELNRKVIEGILVQEGATVYAAADGIEASKILGDFAPDLVLTDINMPGMNGLELLKVIRNHPNEKLRGTPVGALTGSHNLDQLSVEGFGLILRKPIQPAQMIQAISGQVATRETDRRHDSSEIVIPPQLNYLYEVAGRNFAIMDELLSIFTTESPETIKEINQALENNDPQKAAKLFHKFKTNLKYVGLEDAYKQLDDWELALEIKGVEPEMVLKWAEIEEKIVSCYPIIFAFQQQIATI